MCECKDWDFFFLKKGNNEPIRLALATSSALFKFLRGQRAKMRVPACWVEEAGYPDGRFPSYCSNRQSNKSTHRQRECGWSRLFFHFIWPATRYANKNQHCAKEEKKKGLKKRKLLKTVHFWEMFRIIVWKFNPFYKECIQPWSQSLIPPFLKGIVVPCLSWFLCVKDQMMQYAKAPCRENS